MTYPSKYNTAHTISNFATERFMTSTDVMKLLNYRCKATFWTAVHKFGIPYVRINSKRCMFVESVLNDWLKSKSVP